MVYDIIIVGGGPAGLTAGLYANRGLMKTLLLEKLAPGGQIALTEKVENYPGFPEGISGYQLTELMTKQAKKFGLEITDGEVNNIAQTDKLFIVQTESGKYQSRSVIIATGTTARHLGIAEEGRFTGRGISYCATCDAPFFKDKEVIVVGGGDAAVEEGIYLTHFASKVSIVHRRDQLRAAPLIQQRALANPKIQFVWNSLPDGIIGKDKIEGLRVKDVQTGNLSEIPAQGIFVFIGFIPNTSFLKGFIQMDEAGYIMVDREMRTSRPGVFACGDVIKKTLRQLVNGCGEGAVAAFNAQHYVGEVKI